MKSTTKLEQFTNQAEIGVGVLQQIFNELTQAFLKIGQENNEAKNEGENDGNIEKPQQGKEDKEENVLEDEENVLEDEENVLEDQEEEIEKKEVGVDEEEGGEDLGKPKKPEEKEAEEEAIEPKEAESIEGLEPSEKLAVSQEVLFEEKNEDQIPNEEEEIVYEENEEQNQRENAKETKTNLRVAQIMEKKDENHAESVDYEFQEEESQKETNLQSQSNKGRSTSAPNSKKLAEKNKKEEFSLGFGKLNEPKYNQKARVEYEREKELLEAIQERKRLERELKKLNEKISEMESEKSRLIEGKRQNSIEKSSSKKEKKKEIGSGTVAIFQKSLGTEEDLNGSSASSKEKAEHQERMRKKKSEKAKREEELENRLTIVRGCFNKILDSSRRRPSSKKNKLNRFFNSSGKRPGSYNNSPEGGFLLEPPLNGLEYQGSLGIRKYSPLVKLVEEFYGKESSNWKSHKPKNNSAEFSFAPNRDPEAKKGRNHGPLDTFTPNIQDYRDADRKWHQGLKNKLAPIGRLKERDLHALREQEMEFLNRKAFLKKEVDGLKQLLKGNLASLGLEPSGKKALTDEIELKTEILNIL